MLNNNIVKLTNESTIIYEQIKKFLTKHAYNSEKTYEAYKGDIEQFFQIIKGKNINNLTMHDIKLTLDDFEDFIHHLYTSINNSGERRYSNKTINRKLAAVKSLMKYLATKEATKKYVGDISYLDLVESLPEKTNIRGVLEANEVFKMADLALLEREKGNIKRLAILFSFDTCVRINELLNLKWNDFIIREHDVLVKGIGKGNKEFRESISKEFYQELLKIKGESEKVFDISEDSLRDAFNRIKKKMNIPEERNITFHSLRKAGATFRYRITGDILEAQRALRHSNLNTTKIYMDYEDYGALGGVSIQGNLDMDLYKKADHDILLEAIELLPKSSKLILNIKINEILSKKNDV